ncbi:hypothetical protein C8J56DRAFT_735035, partial [Mycena floridula]
FTIGKIHIVCATDAAGMGCNVSDIKYCIVFNCPRSFSVLAQQWGHTGRDHVTKAVCLLLV